MKTLGSILLFVLFFTFQCTAPQTADSSTQQITIKEQVQKGAMLVDVRTPQEFADGSVSGAVNIPLDEVQNRVGEFRDKPYVVVFCKTGNRSGQAKQILEKNGIKNVTNGINVSTMEKELQ
ncbi:MAG: rhodanese-like domain-containing protein [Weeksellaceae bacterium]|nr:rhodanese-like domain-containing protein [Weeksellaceae bacterium]